MAIKYLLEPLGDRIVLRPLVAPGVVGSGIVAPEHLREAPTLGLVLVVGPDVPAHIKAGDTILYGKFTVAPIELGRGSEGLMVMRAPDVWAIVQTEETPDWVPPEQCPNCTVGKLVKESPSATVAQCAECNILVHEDGRTGYPEGSSLVDSEAGLDVPVD